MSNQIPGLEAPTGLEIPYFLRKFALATLRTGSRVICSPPVMNTDFDIVVLLKSVEDCQYIDDEGYIWTEPKDENYSVDLIETTSGNGHWLKTYRKGDINLICLIDPTRFGRWKLATEIATMLNLTKRDDRVLLFAAIKLHQEYTPISLGN